MQTNTRITSANDLNRIEALYASAFPDEDLKPLVRALHGNHKDTIAYVVELLNEGQNEIVAHIIFTQCSLRDGSEQIMLLGPLVVAADKQRLGFGNGLVRFGIEQLRVKGSCLLCVLGDPAYYQRFGFSQETRVQPPYPLKPEWHSAWQSVKLCDESIHYTGQLEVPSEWAKPELWT